MKQAFIEILQSTEDERRALFSAVASDLETRAENIEKDLYVCWVLDFLFNRRPADPVRLYFKGGTSLSKAYGLIRRFSEDIDIGIYKADLNAPLEADIAALPSVNQQQKALAEQVDEAARQYIAGPLRDVLSKEIAVVEDETGQSGHFTLDFGYDTYRKKEALDILVSPYRFAPVHSIELLAKSTRIFADKCIAGIEPDREQSLKNLMRSSALATVFVPKHQLPRGVRMSPNNSGFASLKTRMRPLLAQNKLGKTVRGHFEQTDIRQTPA
ncbi:Nucleotidyl transferase AbiEii toxin, Type IV TA system [Rhizobium mongolense subsp. loessense]|uniref:Nucleotidyl transferase AbiEii toxin, Type IV TA system n=1 Tax=Rhizobium mongolense subsp. loessense TaxID=158890 RepID=A0A1G4S1M2_9HYPH|nr:Nucleotidyl transferase AbiEii toxin, Type IV TA system [Rhizobium mongolense subsp. loessense]